MSKGCDFCNARHLMKKVMNSIEELPEFNVPMYDDPITDVFNAADHAFNALRCYCDDLDQSESRPTPAAPDSAMPELKPCNHFDKPRINGMCVSCMNSRAGEHC